MRRLTRTVSLVAATALVLAVCLLPALVWALPAAGTTHTTPAATPATSSAGGASSAATDLAESMKHLTISFEGNDIVMKTADGHSFTVKGNNSSLVLEYVVVTMIAMSFFASLFRLITAMKGLWSKKR